MSGEMPAADAPGGSAGSEWDEARIEEAMQRLKLLHIKERMLRDTIPKMLEPFVKKHPAPDILFKAFMKAVLDAQANIKEFGDLMTDDVSKEIFEQAKKSQAEQPYGIKPWTHDSHPDWFNLDAKDC